MWRWRWSCEGWLLVGTREQSLIAGISESFAQASPQRCPTLTHLHCILTLHCSLPYGSTPEPQGRAPTLPTLPAWPHASPVTIPSYIQLISPQKKENTIFHSCLPLLGWQNQLTGSPKGNIFPVNKTKTAGEVTFTDCVDSTCIIFNIYFSPF